jgi:hypothetical protein
MTAKTVLDFVVADAGDGGVVDTLLSRGDA